jgi:hypothetical protein
MVDISQSASLLLSATFDKACLLKAITTASQSS